MRFTQGWVHRKAPGQGASRIVQDLKQQGIAPEAIAAVKLELKETEFARAQAVWSRKFANGHSAPADATHHSTHDASPMSQAEYAKQGRFLASRGFSLEVIRRVLKQTSRQGDNGEDDNSV